MKHHLQSPMLRRSKYGKARINQAERGELQWVVFSEASRAQTIALISAKKGIFIYFESSGKMLWSFQWKWLCQFCFLKGCAPGTRWIITKEGIKLNSFSTYQLTVWKRDPTYAWHRELCWIIHKWDESSRPYSSLVLTNRCQYQHPYICLILDPAWFDLVLENDCDLASRFSRKKI
jgi:hypothetical protein